MKKRVSTRRATAITVEDTRSGERRRVRITAPRSFFGWWTVSTLKPKRTARVHVYCARGGQVRFKWNAGARDVDTQRAMLAAVNAAVGRISRASWANISGKCRA